MKLTQFFFFGFGVLTLSACAAGKLDAKYKPLGKRYQIVENELPCSKGTFQNLEGNPLNGKYKLKLDDRKKLFAEFQNGLMKDSAYTFLKGKLSDMEHYSAGVPDGTFYSKSRIYSQSKKRNISVRKTGTYNNGKLSGTKKVFMEDTLWSEAEYVNGIKSGQQVFYENEDTAAIYNYSIDTSIHEFPEWYAEKNAVFLDFDVLGEVTITRDKNLSYLNFFDISYDLIHAHPDCNLTGALIVYFEEKKLLVYFRNSVILAVRN